mgnify:CR=1 FL=1
MDLMRRRHLQQLSCLGLTCMLSPLNFAASPNTGHLTHQLGKTRERLNPIGMGTWITFNVGRSKRLIDQRSQVLQTFFDAGGQVIDSSPMYGSAEQVLGETFKLTSPPARLFTATKTWTSSAAEGKTQFTDSLKLWQQPNIDLLQIHNLVAWQTHLPMLRELKQQNLIRYIGITTSHGRRHSELLSIIESHDIDDFVQLTYNIRDREVEQRLLPAALERGIAVIANRPLDGGRLMKDFQRASLPAWAKELGINNWAQYFLRFIISHPAITLAIPATSQIAHMKENMGAANTSPLPNSRQRAEMIKYLKQV